MKKFILIICLVLSLTACHAETPIPTTEEITQSAIPLYEILFSCPSVTSFEEAPDAYLADEAVQVFLAREDIADEIKALSPDQVYSLLFSGGVYQLPMPEMIPVKAFPARTEIESAIESGVGTIIVSLCVENDYGFGMEFSYYVDVHIIPDQTAPYGAKITRVFFPE